MRARLRHFLLLLVSLTPPLAYAQVGVTGEPAQPAGGEPPTAGVRLHAPSLLDAEPTALETNPAALGLLSAWSLQLHHSEMRSDGRMDGGGDALFLATPFPFYKRLVLGLGLQWLRPPDAIGYPDSVKLSMGLAWSPHPAVSFGFGYHGQISDNNPGIDGLETLDMGLVLRPFRWIGTGFTVRNLTTPVVNGLPLQRRYDIELAVRPLLSQRLELSGGMEIGERRGTIDPHFRLAVEPLWGLQLFAHLQLMRRDFYRTGDPLTDVRASAGLRFSFENFAFATSAVFGRHLDSGPGPLGASKGARSAFQGASFSMTVTGQRQRSIAAPPRVIELGLGGPLDQRQMITLVRALSRMKRRSEVRGVLLTIDGLSCGWAQTQELRALLQGLQRAGKKVYAYLQAPSGPEYYLAAVADHVMLDPAGTIDLKGLAAQRPYLRGLLDKIGVNAQYIRIAEYKSAPEMVTRTGPSKPALEMQTKYVDSVFGQLVWDLSKDRDVTAQRMRALIDRGPFTPPSALSAKLVDEIIEQEDARKRVRRMARAQIAPIEALRRTPTQWPVGPSVALIVIDGEIVHGTSRTIPIVDRHIVGDEDIIDALSRARRSSRIRAIVVRINSPGGSALAAERIWQAVRRARKVKPVIVSLANISASGGYYAAAAADMIFAQPATLTGSIGIYSGKFDLSGLMHKLGINTHTIARGKHSTIDALDRPYTPEQRSFITGRLQHTYHRFLQAVKSGRNMQSLDDVRRVAGGRIWSGATARSNKLVDRLGGLSDAIHEARRRTGLCDDAKIVVLPRPNPGLLARALKLVTSSSEEPSLKIPVAIRSQLRILPPEMWYAAPDEPLARLPFAEGPLVGWLP